MIVMPAVDLRDGACVQLVGGSYADERIRWPDPLGVARQWCQLGFRRLHVVDLDAATERGDNAGVVEDILRDAAVEVQVAGGVRRTSAVQRLVELGALHIVVGTRALEDPDWLADIATAFPSTIVVATDVRERKVVTRGWVRTLPVDIVDLVRELDTLPLAGILVTAVHLEGQMRGTDLRLMEEVVGVAHVPVLASGGVSSVNDLRALEHRGVSCAVVGMALYTGALDARAVASEFGE